MAFGLNPTAGRSPDLKHVDPRLVSIVAGGAAGLPDGYKVTVNEGYNPNGHVANSQHHIAGKGAIDVTIWDPNGNAIPNKGKDTTGMYGNLARLSYGYMLQNYPDLKGKFASGMSFDTTRKSGVPDLMHFDLGGERGRPSPWAGKGPFVPPMNVGQTAQGRQMALGQGRGRINSGPQVRQLQEQLAAKGYSPGKIDGIYGPKTATAVRNFETDNHLNVDKGVAGPQVLSALNGSQTGGPPTGMPWGVPPTPQGFPTAWGVQPETTPNLYGRPVPTSTIGPPTIPGSPPSMGPGLPTYDPGNNALESAMGPSSPSFMGAPPPMGPGMSPTPAVEPLSAGLQQVIDRGSYRDQRGFKAPPIASFSGSATAFGGAPQTGGGMSADLTPRPGTVDDTPYATRLLYDHTMAWPGAGQPPAGSPDVPVAAEHYPLTGDESINSVWEHIKDIPGAWARTLGFGPDQSPAAPPQSLYDRVPPAVPAPTQGPSDLTPWGPGFGAPGGMISGGGSDNYLPGGDAAFMMPQGGPIDISSASLPPNPEAGYWKPVVNSNKLITNPNFPYTADVSAMRSDHEPQADAAWKANYESPANQYAQAHDYMHFISGFMKSPAHFTDNFYAPGRRESDMIDDRRVAPTSAMQVFMRNHPTGYLPDDYTDGITSSYGTDSYIPSPAGGQSMQNFSAPWMSSPDSRGAMASSVYVPRPWDRTDIMGPTMPPMGISGGGMMNHAGGLVDMPEAFGGPGNFRPVDYASAGSAWDPRAPAVSGNAPLGRRGDQISPPSANPIDMFGSDSAGASEVPMFAGKPITDTTLSGIQHFGTPSIAPAGGAPSWDNSAIYGGPDFGGTQPGYGLSAPFMAAPAPDLTVSPAGSPATQTKAAVQAIQQATQGGGSSGGAGRSGSPISPTSYGGSPGSYAYMGSTPWGGSIYSTPSGGPSYSPYTPSGYTAPNFTNGSGGSLYAYHPDGNGGGTYITSDGRTMSY